MTRPSPGPDYVLLADRYVDEIELSAINPKAQHAVETWDVGVGWGMYLLVAALQFVLDHGDEQAALRPALIANGTFIPASTRDRPGFYLRCRRMWHGEPRYARLGVEVYLRELDRGPILDAQAVVERDPRPIHFNDFVRSLHTDRLGRRGPFVGMQLVALGRHGQLGEVEAAWAQITDRP